MSLTDEKTAARQAYELEVARAYKTYQRARTRAMRDYLEAIAWPKAVYDLALEEAWKVYMEALHRAGEKYQEAVVPPEV